MPQTFSERVGRAIRARSGYHAFVPKPLPPEINYSPTLIRLVGEAEHALGELAGVGSLLPNPRFLSVPAVLREAVLSSRIEGTHTNVDELLMYESGEREITDAADAREVHNYVVALEYGLARLDTLPLSLRLIREIHERLMDGVRGGAALPGQFRTTQNWIGPPGSTLSEAHYVPPPVPEMHESLGELESYLHKESDPNPLLVRLALIHSQFEMIHPFVDGNGRVGRLLISLLLCHWQLLPAPLLCLSAFFERYRDDYYRHLQQVHTHGRWEAWIEYFLRGVRTQARDAVTSAVRLLELQQRYQELLAGQRLSKIALPLLDELFVNPVVTAPAVRDRWQVNFRTALTAIGNLAEAGILREISGRTRNRTWVATEILALISGSAPNQDTQDANV